MKTILLSLAATFALVTAKAQYTQNFESSAGTLTGNCWSITGFNIANTAPDVINGSGSLVSQPVTNESTTDLITPALSMPENPVTISFLYKLSSTINGNATRTIEIGIINVAGIFTSLQMINMNHNSPTTVQTFNQSFNITSGKYKLVIKIGGSLGDGNTRVILDDLYTSAIPLYGSGTCNSAPVAVNDNYFGPVNGTFYGNVMTNDSDPNGEAMTAAIVSSSPNATITLNTNGSFSITPAIGFGGSTITFTYRLTDAGFTPLQSNTATVTLNLVAGTLPVKMTSFTATLNINKADLKWTTASEMNVSHFVVEKGFDGSDFNAAGIVFANGNTNSKMNYSFSDNVNTNQDGLIYYRLRSVDVDGKSQYSGTRIIRLGKTSINTLTVSAYPNPVTSELRVMIPNEWQNKKVVYELYNNNGQVAKRIEAVSGSQTETIRVDGLASGLYVVRVSCNGDIAQQNIVKQ